MSVAIYECLPDRLPAIQWLGYNTEEVLAFCTDEDGDGCFYPPQEKGEKAFLYVAANKVHAPLDLNEWILKDSEGYYPCKPARFAQKYKKVKSGE